MKNATTRDFLEEIEQGEAYIRYAGKDFHINGCQCVFGENWKILSTHMDIFDITDTRYEWKHESGTPAEAMKAFLSEPLIDGKTFWELEPDLEWTDGPAHF